MVKTKFAQSRRLKLLNMVIILDFHRYISMEKFNAKMDIVIWPNKVNILYNTIIMNRDISNNVKKRILSLKMQYKNFFHGY